MGIKSQLLKHITYYYTFHIVLTRFRNKNPCQWFKVEYNVFCVVSNWVSSPMLVAISSSTDKAYLPKIFYFEEATKLKENKKCDAKAETTYKWFIYCRLVYEVQEAVLRPVVFFASLLFGFGITVMRFLFEVCVWVAYVWHKLLMRIFFLWSTWDMNESGTDAYYQIPDGDLLSKWLVQAEDNRLHCSMPTTRTVRIFVNGKIYLNIVLFKLNLYIKDNLRFSRRYEWIWPVNGMCNTHGMTMHEQYAFNMRLSLSAKM